MKVGRKKVRVREAVKLSEVKKAHVLGFSKTWSGFPEV